MKKRMKIANSVVAQAKARASSSPVNVIPLSDAASSAAAAPLHSRVDQTPDPITGSPRLRVIILGRTQPEVHDLSSLLRQPQLALLLTEGFRCWAAGVSGRTRSTATVNLGRFARVLAEGEAEALSEIDEAYWSAVVRRLNAPKEDGQPWAIRTRASTLGQVRTCIEALLDHSVHAATARYLLYQSGFPRNPWPGRHRKTIPTAVLTPSEKDQMVLACLAEIAEINSRLRDNETILCAAHERLDQARSSGQRLDYRNDIGVCAALIDEVFPGRLAGIEDLRALDRNLCLAVSNKHGILAVRQLLYGMFRDLVPFVLLLGVKTAFNPETLLSLRWSNIRYSFDGRLITIAGEKDRASAPQTSANEAGNDSENGSSSEFQAELGVPGGLADFLDTLRRLTGRTRTILANRDHADRLFVGVPVQGGAVAKAFEHRAGPAVDAAWRHSFEQFYKDHGLKPFTLNMLRPTEGEEEYRRTGGDLKAVQHRLGHRTVNTTRTFYTTDWMRRGGQDRIAETQELYIRWAESEGCADPRGKADYTRGATTPGFMCLDPYDSPRSGQRKGKLCAAYGECPACQFSAARPRNAQAVALYQALRRAIYAGQQGRVSGKGWHAKWAPVLDDLNRLLAIVPPEVMSAAAQYRVVLKAVG